MSHIRSTLAALLVAGGAAVVGAQQPATPQAQAHAQHGARRGGPGMRAARGLFRGITLSDAEKANLKAVRERYAGQMKALHGQFKSQDEQTRADMRAARQRGDTAAAKALRQKLGPEREQMKTLLQAERADLRASLTPANQTKFDANVATMQKRLAARAGKARQNGRPGFRGGR